MWLKIKLILLIFLLVYLFFPPQVNAQIPADPQYIIINSVMNNPNLYIPPIYPEDWISKIESNIGTKGTQYRRFGLQQLITYMENGYDHESDLKKMLALSLQRDIPVFILFDGEHFWDTRFDLWNWWDPSKPGYNPENKNNVEWTGWSPNDAVKLCWRNWGTQERIAPCQNLGSPTLINEKKTRLNKLIPIVISWYNSLPQDKKYLLAGVSVAHELPLPNGYYYENGNSFVDEDKANDPQSGTTLQLGYAAVKSYGIASSGSLSQYNSNMNIAMKLHATMLSETAGKLRLPRNKLFVHGGGGETPYDIYKNVMNNYATPGWSFYGYAYDPADETLFTNSLNSLGNTPWAALEWRYIGNIGGDTAQAWSDALLNTLNYRNNQMVIIYNSDVVFGNCPGLTCEGAKEGIREALNTPVSCWLTTPVTSSSIFGNNVTFSWQTPPNTTSMSIQISNSSTQQINGAITTANIINEVVTGKSNFTKTLPNGTYYWQLITDGCSNQRRFTYDSFTINSSIPGDLNNDGHVDMADFTKLVEDFGTLNVRSDINNDGKVDIFDYNILVGNFGKT